MKIAVDTNILVRSFVNDESVQFKAVARLIRGNDIVIAASVILETEWVLRGSLKLSREKVAAAFEGLLGASNVTVLQSDALIRALAGYREGCDFADAFHWALSAPADAFVTFDRRFARRATTLGLDPEVQLLTSDR